jgi:hypothetical protein
MKYLITTVVGIGLGVLLSIAWWRLWMNHSWPGPPPFLRPFITTDGEGVYDRVAYEMMIISSALVLVITHAVARFYYSK